AAVIVVARVEIDAGGRIALGHGFEPVLAPAQRSRQLRRLVLADRDDVAGNLAGTPHRLIAPVIAAIEPLVGRREPLERPGHALGLDRSATRFKGDQLETRRLALGNARGIEGRLDPEERTRALDRKTGVLLDRPSAGLAHA